MEKIKQILINGLHLNYIELGEGPPLIFVHGSLGDLNTFTPQFEPFSKHYHIIAYSRRFHPPNNWDDNDKVYSMAQHVDDLASLITKLNFDKVHLVGSSYGAYTSLVLTSKHPSLVRTLTLGEPPMLPLLMTLPEGAAMLNTFIKNALEPSAAAFRSGNKEEGLRKFLDGIKFPGAFDQIPPDGRQNLMKYADAMSLEMQSDPEKYFTSLSLDQLKKINVPVLLVKGDKTPALLLKITEILAASLPDNQQVIIPNAGHSMYKDNPEEFNKKVLTFLSRH